MLDEFVYYGNNLQKVESPLSKIAEGLIEYLTTGKYEDKTDVALPNVSPQPNTNNNENINCNTNMKQSEIRLTESQLHRVIKESVKNVLNEAYASPDKEARHSLEAQIDKFPGYEDFNDTWSGQDHLYYCMQSLKWCLETFDNYKLWHLYDDSSKNYVHVIKEHLRKAINLLQRLGNKEVMRQGEQPDIDYWLR